MTGVSGDITITGGANDNRINGGSVTISGGDGNDLFYAGLGNDSFNGESGNDIAIFTGKYSDYNVQFKAENGNNIVLIKSSEGSKFLYSIEVLNFADVSLEYNQDTFTFHEVSHEQVNNEINHILEEHGLDLIGVLVDGGLDN